MKKTKEKKKGVRINQYASNTMKKALLLLATTILTAIALTVTTFAASQEFAQPQSPEAIAQIEDRICSMFGELKEYSTTTPEFYNTSFVVQTVDGPVHVYIVAPRPDVGYNDIVTENALLICIIIAVAVPTLILVGIPASPPKKSFESDTNSLANVSTRP